MTEPSTPIPISSNTLVTSSKDTQINPKLTSNDKPNGQETEKTKIKPGVTAEQSPSLPGSYSESNKHGLPDWYKVGWTSFSQLPNPGDEASMEQLSQQLGTDALTELYKGSHVRHMEDLIGQFLNEAYYGEWYHNTAVLLFTVVFTWLITRLGGGLMGCFVVCAFLATYYQTSIRRLRRNVRDDVQRELMSNKLETDIESAGWINHFLSRFWLIYEPVLSAQIIGTADAILIESTPSFLDSIRLSTFTLGTKAPRIDGIKTYPRTEPNVVCMDWKLSFIPNDVLDLSQRDLQSKVNPKIVLTIRVGKGMLGAGMPVLLEDIAFSGTLRLKFRLFNEFPHVKTVEASFLEKPHFDYSLKPVGGETFGFDINNIPGLQTFVQEQVHATLGPMMYAPNVYTVDVAGIMAGTIADLDSANGVLALTIYSGSNLKGSDMFGTLDPYVTFHIGDVRNPELGRTSAHEDTSNPKWDETHFLLINNLNDKLCLQLMDRNTGRKDSDVGLAVFELKELSDSNNVLEGLNIVLLRNGKPVGELKCDMRYFPVARAEKQEDGTIIPPAESNSGVLRFTVHECQGLGGEVRKSGFNLPIPGVGGSDIDAYAIVRANGVEKLRTKTFKRSINPRWDKYFELFVPDKTKMDLNVIIMNNKEFSDDEVIGRWKSSLVAMEEQLAQQDWWTLKDGVGKIHLSAIWKPVPMIGFTESLGRGSYRPPIGVIRVKFFGAKDLKNVETLTGGKSDPYVRILSGMQVRGQTDYVTDNLDPQWNTALYVPVHSIREDLVFEVMDYNDIHKDKTMGITELVLKDVVKEVTQDDGQIIYEALETVERSVELTSSEHKKGRGILHYAASFYPTLALAKKAAEEKKDSKTDQKPEPVADENKEQVAEASEPTKDVEKPEELPEKDLHGELIKYTEDKKIDLLAYESGILSVTIHGAKLLERVKITADILVDSNDPQYRTVQAKGLDLPFNETGDAFVKEMDFSRIVVRLKPVKDDKDDSNLGYWTSSVRDIVRQIQNRDGNEDPVKEYKLLNGDGATVRLSFDFTPVVQFKLDPNESLENQGNLTVTALKATNLPAADRSGTSDPYVVFLMNGEKVHKTEVHKKNLNPVFKNESFTVPVHKRGEAILVAEIYDWDQIGKNTLLGRCEIPFTGDVIESFAAKDVEVPIQDGATLRVRLLWQPQLLARKRTGTSLFSATTRIFTHAPGTAFDVGKEVVGAGFGAGGKVLGAGGKVIGGGVSMIGGGVHAIGGGVSAIGNGIRGIHVFSKKEKIEEHHHYTVTESPATPEPTRSSATDHGSIESSISSGIQGSDNSMNGSGGATIQVTLLEARNLKAMDRGGTSDPYARVRVNGKILHKTRHIKKTLTPSWEESFTTKIGSDRSVLEIMVKDYNKLNDVDIGEANLDVWKSLNNQTSFDGWLPLTPEGTGEVHVRVEVVQESGIAGRVGGFFGMK